jgi:phosphatidylethanolamine-binding protein (PEBP) family uncharacterized protein
MEKRDMAFSITSPAFASDGAIPPAYTADGEDLSPPLTWSDAPPRAKSVLPDLGAPTKAELETALTGHVLATAELVGTYERDR